MWESMSLPFFNLNLFQILIKTLHQYDEGFFIPKSNYKLGTLAQMVEQWTENPCVPGSIPGGTTKPTLYEWVFCF